jgi:hypothetical protein
MDFEPPNAITLHLIVSKMPERIVWQRFYTYSASPNYSTFSYFSINKKSDRLLPIRKNAIAANLLRLET